MKSIALTIALVVLSCAGITQHTFSIVAIDTATSEIGSAGATCGDSIIWPGTPGAYIISDILPGIGAIHTQAAYLSGNKANANLRMAGGYSPEEVIDYALANDVQGDTTSRQYGVVGFHGGTVKSAGYTGANCLDEKAHITGPTYAIQGNILLDSAILDSMEARFLNAQGCLADRLMQAMQGANEVGADSRCSVYGTSSLSAFIRVAKPGDPANDFHLDINVAATPNGVEPIDELQTRYDNWKSATPGSCNPLGLESKRLTNISLFPNPGIGGFSLRTQNEVTNIRVFNAEGKLIDERSNPQKAVHHFEHLKPGLYTIKVLNQDGAQLERRVVIQ